MKINAQYFIQSIIHEQISPNWELGTTTVVDACKLFGSVICPASVQVSEEGL